MSETLVEPEVKMDLVKRCMVCRRTETKPTPVSLFSDGILSKTCFKYFYPDMELVNGIDHETCEDLHGPYGFLFLEDKSSLVVDFYKEFMRRNFKNFNHNFLDDPQKVQQLLRNEGHGIGLVVLDIKLGGNGFNGIDMVNQYRELNPDLKYLVSSDTSTINSYGWQLDKFNIPYVTKSNPKELKEKIKTILLN